jgi:branched-chain amino acid transport system ATP-binding protein
MSVEENLLVAAGTSRRRAGGRLDEVYEIFPRLGERERRRQRAESLSGGEQQMLAIGRALMMGPQLIMMDEPSQGLSPAAVETVVSSVTRIAETGVTVIVVEQNVPVLLPVVTAALTVSLGTVRAADRTELETDEALSGLLGGPS